MGFQIDPGLVGGVETMPEYGMFGGLKGFFGLGNKNGEFKPNITFASFNFLRWNHLAYKLLEFVCVLVLW